MPDISQDESVYLLDKLHERQVLPFGIADSIMVQEWMYFYILECLKLCQVAALNPERDMQLPAALVLLASKSGDTSAFALFALVIQLSPPRNEQDACIFEFTVSFPNGVH